MGEEAQSRQPTVLLRLHTPVRRWLPVALGAALALGAVKPFADGDVASLVSFAIWVTICLIVTAFRNRSRYVVVDDSVLTIRWNGREPARMVELAAITRVSSITTGTRRTLLLTLDSGELVPLPNPDVTWWMWQGEKFFEQRAADLTARVEEGLRARGTIP